MKIAWLTHRDVFHPRAGGAEVVVDIHSRHQVSQGHSVTWLTSGFAGAPKVQDHEGVQIRRYSREALLNWHLLFLSRHLSREFDVVIESLCKVPFFWPNLCPSPNIVYTFHLFGSTVFREVGLLQGLYVCLLEKLIPLFYGKSVFVALSPSTRQDLMERGIAGDRIAVVEGGVDTAFYGQVLFEKAPEPLFLYVGRLKKYKGIDYVIRSMAGVRAAHSRARLVIVGKGDHEPHLRRIVGDLGLKDCVEFVGWVTDKDKRQWMQKAWAMVYPSPKEGQGLTVLEGGAGGTATVGSRSPGLRDFVLHGRTGLLVEHGDIKAWENALTGLAGNREQAMQYGLDAREFSLRFTWERSAKMLTEVIQRNLNDNQ